MAVVSTARIARETCAKTNLLGWRCPCRNAVGDDRRDEW
jgi:hypothetical protein